MMVQDADNISISQPTRKRSYPFIQFTDPDVVVSPAKRSLPSPPLQSKDYRVFKQGLDKFGGRGGHEGDQRKAVPSTISDLNRPEAAAVSHVRRPPVETSSGHGTSPQHLGLNESIVGVRENADGHVYAVPLGSRAAGQLANSEVRCSVGNENNGGNSHVTDVTSSHVGHTGNKGSRSHMTETKSNGSSGSHVADTRSNGRGSHAADSKNYGSSSHVADTRSNGSSKNVADIRSHISDIRHSDQMYTQPTANDVAESTATTTAVLYSRDQAARSSPEVVVPHGAARISPEAALPRRPARSSPDLISGKGRPGYHPYARSSLHPAPNIKLAARPSTEGTAGVLIQLERSAANLTQPGGQPTTPNLQPPVSLKEGPAPPPPPSGESARGYSTHANTDPTRPNPCWPSPARTDQTPAPLEALRGSRSSSSSSCSTTSQPENAPAVGHQPMGGRDAGSLYPHWSGRPGATQPISRKIKQQNRTRKFNSRYPAPEKPRQKRAVIQDMVRPLKHWLLRHRHNPYPTKAEKLELAVGSSMTLVQVSNWFANARRRLKNVVQETRCSWSKRLRLYNRFVQGNAELLSISSDDSIWNSEDDNDNENENDNDNEHDQEEEDEHESAESPPQGVVLEEERGVNSAAAAGDCPEAARLAEHSYSIPGCLTPPDDDSSPAVSTPGHVTPYVSPPSSPPTLTPQRPLSPPTPELAAACPDTPKYKTNMLYRYLQDAAEAQETFAEDCRKDEENRLVIDEKCSRLGDFDDTEDARGEEENSDAEGGSDHEQPPVLTRHNWSADHHVEGGGGLSLLTSASIFNTPQKSEPGTPDFFTTQCGERTWQKSDDDEGSATTATTTAPNQRETVRKQLDFDTFLGDNCLPLYPFPPAFLPPYPMAPPVGAQEEVSSPPSQEDEEEGVPVSSPTVGPPAGAPTFVQLYLPLTQSGSGRSTPLSLATPPGLPQHCILAPPPGFYPHWPPFAPFFFPLPNEANCDIGVGSGSWLAGGSSNSGGIGGGGPPPHWSELEAAMALSQLAGSHHHHA